MPQNGNVTIKDGASTPVDHTLQPAGINSQTGSASFVERVDGVLIGELALDVIIRPVTKGQPTRKATVLLHQPKRVTDDQGNVTVAHENLGKAEFTYSALSTSAERKNLRVLLANAILNTGVAQAIDNNETYW